MENQRQLDLSKLQKSSLKMWNCILFKIKELIFCNGLFLSIAQLTNLILQTIWEELTIYNH